jgi:glycerol dehydrogenase-like iron-containing ADH family enzyme
MITTNYVNDQLSFINFLLGKNCVLVQSDETMYNNFASKIENSSKTYKDAVSYMYNINLQRVKEFNLHFKNENIDKLIDIIPDGVINGK